MPAPLNRKRPKNLRHTFARLLSYMGMHKFLLAVVAVLVTVSALSNLLGTYMVKPLVNRYIVPGDIRGLIFGVAVTAAIYLTGALAAWGYTQTMVKAAQKIIYDMRNQMYDHLQHMPHAFFTGEKQGDIITRMNSDINGVSSIISVMLTSLVSNVLTVATSVFYLFYTDWRLAIVGLVVLPLLILPTKAVGKKRWELVSEAQGKQDELNQHVDETLSVSGSMLVKLFTKEKVEYEKFRSINNEATKITIKEQRAGSWFHVFLGMFIQIAPLLIYFVGGFLIISRFDAGLTVGDISVVVSLVNRLYQPVRQLLDLQVNFVRSLALFTRIFEYYDRKIEIDNPENPVKPPLDDCSVEFCDVHFSYEKEHEILKGISFFVPNGKTYAIVGTSGAGKSTIIGMIPRLYDVTSGCVKVAGTDVRDFDLSYLRTHIGIVTQDTYLFNGTILENLLYAKPDATKEKIENACRVANIYDFINGLPDKFDTVVGNRGLKLSGGEKQRVSIARVVLKDPKILILDEATSSLDSISESLIQSALSAVMKGRTSIVIAHRLSTVIAADKIMVIENGIITETGSHEELIETSRKYRELYETQFKKVLEYEKQHSEKHSGK